MRSLFFISSILFVLACTNEPKELRAVLPKHDMKIEIAEDVTILYSDSAIVRVRITSPALKRYESRGENYDEFPQGLLVEFLDDRKKPKSWLKADYAIRKENAKKIFVEDNVVLYNKRNDQLMTSELIWDENAEELYTSKAVKIAQPAQGDTIFGFGFKADQEFTRFEIQRRFSAIKNVDELTSELNK
jgi:LPS export ABC transporter protein LptC